MAETETETENAGGWLRLRLVRNAACMAESAARKSRKSWRERGLPAILALFSPLSGGAAVGPSRIPWIERGKRKLALFLYIHTHTQRCEDTCHQGSWEHMTFGRLMAS